MLSRDKLTENSFEGFGEMYTHTEGGWRWKAQQKRTVIIIGDIHGCYDIHAVAQRTSTSIKRFNKAIVGVDH